MTSYPGTIATFTSKTDGIDSPMASHVNSLQDEVTAIENALKINWGGSPAVGDVLYYDGTSWTKYTIATATITFTNKRITKRPVTVTQSATPAINTDNGDIFNITGLAQAITSLTTSLTGTPVDGDMIEICFTDDGTARGITRGAKFVSTTNGTMASTTITNKKLRELYQWNSTSSLWECVGSTSSV